MKRGTGLIVVLVALALLVSAAALGGCGSQPVVAKPEVSLLNPTTGPAGTQVQVAGEDFGDSQGTSVVHMGGKVADVVAWSESLVTIKVPSGLTTAAQPVSVLTSSGESNQEMFNVTAAPPTPTPTPAPTPDPKPGQIEHPTPASAIIDWMGKRGMNTQGVTFSVVIQSQKDSNWKIDAASRAGKDTLYFLMKKVSGNWTVVDDGTALTPQELQADGAPSDLWVKVPVPPPPAPENQVKIINDYLTSKGVDLNDVSIQLVKSSQSDPTWQLFRINFPPERQLPDSFVVLHLENNTWVVKAYAENINNTPGMPADLKM